MAQFKQTTVNRKELPENMRWILERFPSYRKHTVSLWTIEDDEIQQSISSYWDGGSREEWTLFGTDRESKPLSYPAYPKNPHVGITVHKGEFLVETGTFCGKPATMRIIAVLGRRLDPTRNEQGDIIHICPPWCLKHHNEE